MWTRATRSSLRAGLALLLAAVQGCSVSADVIPPTAVNRAPETGSQAGAASEAPPEARAGEPIPAIAPLEPGQIEAGQPETPRSPTTLTTFPGNPTPGGYGLRLRPSDLGAQAPPTIRREDIRVLARQTARTEQTTANPALNGTVIGVIVGVIALAVFVYLILRQQTQQPNASLPSPRSTWRGRPAGSPF